VLEDSAEAFGMKTKIKGVEKYAGTIGDFGALSFFPTKTLGGYGDGGMLLTNNEELYKKAKAYRVHGSTIKYHNEYIGYNSRLDTLQAAVLLVKIKYIDDAITKRNKCAMQYRELLSNVPEIKLPLVKLGNKEVCYAFNMQVEKRDDLASYLKENGIGTSVYYPVPLHLQKCFDYLGYKKGDFPVAERLCGQVLAMPVFPELTEDEISYVCETIKAFYKR
jgi:dTDP-4-amino-4,6-dideoxygalactose transaminase